MGLEPTSDVTLDAKVITNLGRSSAVGLETAGPVRGGTGIEMLETGSGPQVGAGAVPWNRSGQGSGWPSRPCWQVTEGDSSVQVYATTKAVRNFIF